MKVAGRPASKQQLSRPLTQQQAESVTVALSHIYMHYVGSLSIHLAVPLGLCMCKGERVKQLRGLSAERRGAARERADGRVSSLILCYLVKCKRNFIITIEGNAAACVDGRERVCALGSSAGLRVWPAAREFIAFH